MGEAWLYRGWLVGVFGSCRGWRKRVEQIGENFVGIRNVKIKILSLEVPFLGGG